MSNRIFLSPPHLSGDEIHFIKSALDSNWIAPVGPDVEAFERELSGLLKSPYVALTSSGTAAIHLSLLALGVGAGDEVICSTLTFCASVNPVLYCGATPVFVDSEYDTWNMDPELLEAAILDRIRKTGKKPKAIVLVHLFGMPAKLDLLVGLSKAYEIPIVEDSAESLGSTYHNRSLGAFGVAGILSFNGNKVITASSGGVVFSNDQKLIERARYYRQEAREPLPYYEHKAVGYNYRFSNVLASLGRAQLPLLPQRVQKRRENFSFYERALTQYGFRFQPEAIGSLSNRWLTAITMNDTGVEPERLRQHLEENNIESRRVWKPMHLQPVYAAYPAYLNGISQMIFDWGLCLPSGSNLSDPDLSRIVETILRVVRT